MCITEYLRTRAEGMGPSEQLTIDRGWIEWLLDRHACGCVVDAGSGAAAPPRSLHGYDVEELAGMFNRSVSAIKAWCSAGVFGDRATLKPNGREWHVPPERIAELRIKLAQGYRITSDGLCEPEVDPPRNTPTKGEAATAPDLAPSRTSRSGPARPRRRSEQRRHNDWRQHIG